MLTHNLRITFVRSERLTVRTFGNSKSDWLLTIA